MFARIIAGSTDERTAKWAARHNVSARVGQGKSYELYGWLFSGACTAMSVIAHTYHGLDFQYLCLHLMQYVWILLALMVVSLLALGDRRAKLLSGLLAGILLASRIWFIAEDQRTERAMQKAFSRSSNVVEAAQPFPANGRILTDQIKRRLAKDATIPEAVRALPGNALILSNQGQLLSHISGRPVRMLPLPSESELSEPTRQVDQVFCDMHSHRPICLVLVPDNRIFHSKDGIAWQEKIMGRLPERYEVIRKDAHLLMIRYPHPLPG